MSAAVAADCIPPTVGVIEAVDDTHCLLPTGSNSLDEIAVYTALFGLGFRVHEPPELVDRLRELAGRVNAAIAPVEDSGGS